MSIDRRLDAVDRLVRDAATASPGTGAGPCPEADLLAAYVEHRLAAEERTPLERHLASCAICQDALALLAMDEPVPTAAPSAVPGRAPRAWLRWLVPAAALAGAVVLYVAVRPGSVEAPAALPEPAQIMAQRSEESPAEPLTAEREPKETASAQAADQGGAGSRAPRREAAAEPPVPKSVTPVAAPPVPAPTVATATKTEPATPDVARPEAQPVQEVLARRADEAPAKRIAAGEAARPQPVMRHEVVDAMRAQVPVVIAAPDGTTLWRLGPEGRIERSADGGRRWTTQTSGVGGTLTSGHALSPTVCWIVGTSGAVVVTTDGEHWALRPIPGAGDLVSVEPSDGATAIVTAADGRRFRTRDGGLTWREVR